MKHIRYQQIPKLYQNNENVAIIIITWHKIEKIGILELHTRITHTWVFKIVFFSVRVIHAPEASASPE